MSTARNYLVLRCNVSDFPQWPTMTDFHIEYRTELAEDGAIPVCEIRYHPDAFSEATVANNNADNLRAIYDESELEIRMVELPPGEI